MRILHIVPGLCRAGGGVSECVPDLCRALHADGTEVGIVTPELDGVSKSAEAAEREGVRVYRIQCVGGKLNRLLLSWRLVAGLERVMRDYGVVHVNGNWLFPVWWAAHVARKLGKPYVMQPHGSFAPERLKISRWKKRVLGIFDRLALRSCAMVLATSEQEAEDIRAYVPGVRTEVHPIGVDVENYKVEGRGRGRERTLLYFSRISPIKGLDLLAEAWGRIQSNNPTIPNQTIWKLLIVGPDDRGYTEEIKKVFAAKCPAGSYEFRGPVYGDEKFKLLASADAFVLPTRNENWGIAVAEAMASGLPVICTKGAPWACLETAKAGHWVDVSAEGIQKGIEDILALSDGDRQAMGGRGRRWAMENLDWKRIAERMKKSYATL